MGRHQVRIARVPGFKVAQFIGDDVDDIGPGGRGGEGGTDEDGQQEGEAGEEAHRGEERVAGLRRAAKAAAAPKCGARARPRALDAGGGDFRLGV